MSSDNPCVVWMANKRWEEPGIDRRMIAEMERYARILWVDPPLTIATSSRRRSGARRPVRPVLSVLNNRVTRLSPTALPGMSRLGVRATTGPLIRAQVRWAIRQTGIEPRAVIATNLEDVLGLWGGEVVNALHGTDDYVAGAGLMGLSARRLRAQERKAVIRADVVTALSPILTERWSELRGAPVSLIPNGCTPVTHDPARLPPAATGLPRPVVGLVGRLNARINMNLLEAVADAGYSLLIVGPHDPRWEPRRFTALIARPSVRYIGSVPEEEVSAYIAAIDVGITPYLDNSFNKASFPLKTLDYLSAGRPAISTTLPASRWLLSDLARSDEAAFSEQIMLLAGDADSFVKSLRRIAGEPGQDGQAANDLPGADPERAHRCRAFAARHTWARRADALAAAIGLAESN